MAEVTTKRRDDRWHMRDRRPLVVGVVVGVVGLALWVVGLFIDPTQALASYLAAFVYVTGLCLGVLGFTMIGRAMGAAWVVAVRGLETIVIGVFPAVAVLFVPVAVGASFLYPWVDPGAIESEHVRHAVHEKASYLQLPFFLVRAAVYLLVWIFLAELLRRREDGRALAAGALPLFGITITFAAFDWLMSLEPAFFSSAYGVYYIAGCLYGGVALLTLLAACARRSGPLSEELTPNHFHALGRVLLTVVVFWAYIAFFQAMLIRIADKPEEIVFYIRRIEDGWAWVSGLLVLGHFALPFFLLLPRRTKFSPRALTAIAVWLLVMHYVDMYWLVLPAIPGHGGWPHWLDLAALAGVGGCAVAVAAWRALGTSLLAADHPRLREALSYRSPSL